MQKTKQDRATEAFMEVWTSLFTTPVHLDSAISKQPATVKSILARTLPAILLRPVSLAQAMGVGVAIGEPWSLTSAEKARWKVAPQLFERLYQSMTGAFPELGPVVEEDFPPRMVIEWKAQWGEERARELMEVLGREAPLSLRCNRKMSAEALLSEFRASSTLPVSVSPSSISPTGVVLGGYAKVMKMGQYEQGAFEIQDEGSQYMSYFTLWPELYGALLTPAPGAVSAAQAPPALPAKPKPWNVIDTCAGAGGKTLAMADALAGKGRVYSYDTSPKKLEALRRRARRAGVNNTQSAPVEGGAEELTVNRFAKSADIVVDAPCSGWGVLRRNPDIKWRQPADVLERMPVLQARLLSAYSDLVKPGGRLVFGVCTFRKEETSQVAEAFLAAKADFRLSDGGYLGPGPCDGFFMQSFIRMEGSEGGAGA